MGILVQNIFPCDRISLKLYVLVSNTVHQLVILCLDGENAHVESDD